jgi:uncharacterized iron-regulated protein
MFRYISTLFLCCAILSLSAQDAATYRLYATTNSQEAVIADIVEAMADYDVVLFGEEHNDSIAHLLQMSLWQALHARYGEEVAISMEMFDRDVQIVMDEYLGGHIREQHFSRDARVWSNYKDYKPMVEYAREHGLDVVCANASKRYTNFVMREGASALERLPKASRAAFAPIPYPMAAGAYFDKLMSFMHGSDHGGAEGPSQASLNFIAAQSLWDATMAWSIHDYRRKKPNRKKKVLHLNGRFHSDEYLGIYAQLKRYNPKTRILVISTGGDPAFPNINWADYRHLGDFIFITDPEMPRSY